MYGHIFNLMTDRMKLDIDKKRINRRNVLSLIGVSGLTFVGSTGSAVAKSGSEKGKSEFERAAEAFEQLNNNHGSIVDRSLDIEKIKQNKRQWTATYQYEDGTEKTVERKLGQNHLKIQFDDEKFNVKLEYLQRKLERETKREHKKAEERLDKNLKKVASKQNKSAQKGEN